MIAKEVGAENGDKYVRDYKVPFVVVAFSLIERGKGPYVLIFWPLAALSEKLVAMVGLRTSFLGNREREAPVSIRNWCPVLGSVT